ncbi:MAG: hypothetical protein AAF869_07955 [Pseudomonadota bacterium]
MTTAAPRAPSFASAPSFDTPVPRGGYLWWYVDGWSDDGAHGLTLIIFVGSVFSPYYAWSTDQTPDNHCALNVALYGAAPNRWAMTERGAKRVERESRRFVVGPSSVRLEDQRLSIDVNERCAPLPRPLRGRIDVTPVISTDRAFTLAEAGGHLWRPVSPKARISVELEQPRLSWRGDAYFDSNQGDEPLHDGFRHWTWCRAHLSDGVAVAYEATPRRSDPASLFLKVKADGAIEPQPSLETAPLPTPLWAVKRRAHCDAGSAPRLLHGLEDAPFYNRSLIQTEMWGQRVQGFHESLSLDRFKQTWVRTLLPVRMPRTG